MLFVFVYIVAFIVIYCLPINRSPKDDEVKLTQGEIVQIKKETYENCRDKHFTKYPNQVDINKWRECNGYD
tara:strand:+ start:171 stop:383 length:213 start_codon:yes stop_codon:yes gene_type:complete